MHPDAADLWSMADGELPPATHKKLALHLAECDSCRQRLGETRVAAVAIARALGTLDHATPPIRAGDVIARARGRRRQRALAAAAVLLFVATGASAAVPNSPLRRLVERWLAAPPRALAPSTMRPSTMRPLAAPSPSAQGARAASGIAFTPGGAATIDFVEAPPEGELRIRLVDGADITITGSSAGTRFALTGQGVNVTPGGVGSFDLEIPRRMHGASVRVAGHVVFAKAGTEVTTEGRYDRSGTVFIRFNSHQRSIP